MFSQAWYRLFYFQVLTGSFINVVVCIDGRGKTGKTEGFEVGQLGKKFANNSDW